MVYIIVVGTVLIIISFVIGLHFGRKSYKGIKEESSKSESKIQELNVYLEKTLNDMVSLKNELLKVEEVIPVVNEQISNIVKRIESSTVDTIDKFFSLNEDIKRNTDRALEINSELKKKLIFDICNTIYSSVLKEALKFPIDIYVKTMKNVREIEDV